MKKKAWPWNNDPLYDNGISDGNPVAKDTQVRLSGLAYGESTGGSAGGSADESNTISSPSSTMTGLKNYSKDKKSKRKSSKKIDVYSGDEILATFACDVAKSMEEKIAGLQTYDTLSDNAGLVFEYKRPEDVVYHMGTVKFPIDIIFIDTDNKIKKIQKNIQPGTLGTYGCSGVKNVLEICGGLCDRLGISSGDIINVSDVDESFEILNATAKEFGINKNIIIKHSILNTTRVSKWNDFPILNIGNSLIKTASKPTPVSDLVSKFYNKKSKAIHIFDFDGLIEQAPFVRIYKAADKIDESSLSLKINGHTVSLVKNASGKYIHRDVHVNYILQNKIATDEAVLVGLNKSLANFLKINADLKDLFLQLEKVANTKNAKPIMITRFENPGLLRDMVMSKYSSHVGKQLNIEVIQVPRESDFSDVVDFFRGKFGNQQYKIYSDQKILKRAGAAISNDVKDKAKNIYKILDSASDLANKSLDNMKVNLAEYNRISANPEAVKNTKGQYNESVKNNKDIFRNLLIKVRDSIKLFNEIKDINTTLQIIDSLTSSSQNCSDSIDEIFKLIDQIENPDFINLLGQKVSAYEKVIEDLRAAINKGKKYINADILGLIILSD